MRRIIFTLLLLLSVSVYCKTITGKIIGVSDGDTVTLLDSTNTRHRIRLDAIDAPESGQAYGKKSKQYLSDLIFGKVVSIEYKKKDQYGRILGTIYYGGKNINEEMIRSGYAWRYYYNKSERLLELQNEARYARFGLWQDKNPIDPYQFRKDRKRKKEAD